MDYKEIQRHNQILFEEAHQIIDEPMERKRIIRIHNFAIGFIEQNKSGLWFAYCYRIGIGMSCFKSEQAAETWVLENYQSLVR